MLRCYYSVWEKRPGSPHFYNYNYLPSKTYSREPSLARELTPERMQVLASEALTASHQRNITYRILWTIPDRILLIFRLMPRDPGSFDPVVDTFPLPNPIPIKPLPA